ncbi:PREDICTED: D-3-phosphoglycerate dehydrogenase-like [Priapulus caudatus]|uniref:D-3-phosphoglycerate dehydrogenase n=1 Tax=Priapulus caudatus TaxID=37621 RepID=A0ABM1DSV1_PRICU|nr:PREDICTED: D-3-phosphoglycerate dehydrogenase-like [Priapulus caudatus]
MHIAKVLITDNIDEICTNSLRSAGIHVDVKVGLTKEQLVADISQYDALVVRSQTKVTADVIQAGKPQLKLVGRAGTGVDNIDLKAASAAGVMVLNTPMGNTMSAAEHTCAMIMACSRNIPQGNEALKAGNWKLRSKLMGNELYEKTIGIIGLGRIGREVATRMQAFGMKTIGYDPLVPPQASKEFGVEGLSLEQIWPQADYLTIHVPLIPQTKNLLCDDVFAKCKPGFRVVNVARGGVVDEDALLRALQSGRCAGAALDVFAEEPPQNAALLQHPRMVATPHLGASTVEGQQRCAAEIAAEVVNASQGKTPNGIVKG